MGLLFTMWNTYVFMKFYKYSDKEFMRTFIHIIGKGSKDADYKFALARFLLEYSENDTKIHVEFSTIAKYFIKYFWPQVCRSKLKHNPHGVKEPVIVQSIKKEFDKPPYPQTYDKILKEHPDKIKKCIEDISNPASILFAFNDVTYAFQHIKVGRGIKNVQPMFFDYKIERLRKLKDRKRLRPIIDKNYGIDINPYALEFFKKFNVALQKIVILEWARLLEKFNVGVPKIIDKTEGLKPERQNLTKYKKALEPFFENCFYCRRNLKKLKRELKIRTDVEHVIPWDYIGEDEIWNLTLACQKCNCRKLGSLPPRKFLDDKLFERNNKFRGTKYKTLGKMMSTSLNNLGPTRERQEEIIKERFTKAEEQGYTQISITEIIQDSHPC